MLKCNSTTFPHSVHFLLNATVQNFHFSFKNYRKSKRQSRTTKRRKHLHLSLQYQHNSSLGVQQHLCFFEAKDPHVRWLIQLVLLVSIQTFKKHCKHCKTLPNILKHDISDLFILTHHFCVTVQQYKCFLSIISALLLVICNKPFLVCVQTQEHIAFLTFPPWHTLWTEVASSLLVTVQRPVSTIIVAHI